MIDYAAMCWRHFDRRAGQAPKRVCKPCPDRSISVRHHGDNGDRAESRVLDKTVLLIRLTFALVQPDLASRFERNQFQIIRHLLKKGGRLKM